MPLSLIPTFALAWQLVLGSLACLLLLSGVDDLIPLLICLFHHCFSRRAAHASPTMLAEMPERRIAIFVPCWDESKVLEQMVRQNIERIRYRNFDFFLGVYPNDQATCDASFDVAANFPNVHVSVCPKAGPTSKADCLNAVYRGMKTFEQANDVRFDTVVLHDAEDVIHADALGMINRERAAYEMVQIPVLPLPTSPADMTHGIYCDEFSEFQLIDMQARQYSGSFVPSNGVGTGFAREVLENFASRRGGQVFDPSSLTEDYDIGLQIHYAGLRQMFYPLEKGSGGILATREYFPRKVRTAIRQRKRWITGIALQSWERHGWRGSLGTRYWFWRDRKGLLTNPLSLLTNLIFLAGATDWVISVSMHRPWSFATTNSLVVNLCLVTSLLQVLRLSIRSLCVAQLFGWKMGATVALRCFHANLVNCVASLGAVKTYAASKFKRGSLRWDKTEHSYPVLLSAEQHTATAPEGFFPPYGYVDPAGVDANVLHSLPASFEKQFHVLPFRVAAGRLLVAAIRVPEAHVFEAIGKFTRLKLEFRIVTRINYAELRELL